MHTDGIWFKDEDGRTLLLRGANLSSTSKLPTRPNGATYSRDGFFDHRDVSFVGRPESMGLKQIAPVARSSWSCAA